MTVIARYTSEAEASGEETGLSLSAGSRTGARKSGAGTSAAWARSTCHSSRVRICASRRPRWRLPTTMALLREHLAAIAALVDVTGQPGVAIDTATDRTVAVSGSREAFREQVSLHCPTSSCCPPSPRSRRPIVIRVTTSCH